MSSIIEVKNLVKSFGGVKAVDGVSFDIKQGQFFGFLGPNGAGKTTTMRILATLDKPTSGTVKVAGYDVVREPQKVRSSIGFAMQAVGLDDLASAWENLILMGTLYGLNRNDAKKRAGELLKMFQLEKVADRFVAKYSGGMRRRLDVATALMHNPKVLFLDEPTEGLDPAGRRVIWKYLKELNQKGTTIFLTTHYMEEADHLVEDLAIINHGKIVVRGTPQDLKDKIGLTIIEIELDASIRESARKMLCKLYAGNECSITARGIAIKTKDGSSLLPKIVKTLEDAKIEVINYVLRSSSLDDVFMKYAGESFIEDDVQKGTDPYIAMRRTS